MGNNTERLNSAAEKRKKALQLRMAGLAYSEIAATIGWADKSSAFKAVKDELARIPRDDAKALMVMELERLDLLQVSLWGAARNGDNFAVDRVIKIMDHRAKLAGLYNTPNETGYTEIKAAFAGFMGQLMADDTLSEDKGGHSDDTAEPSLEPTPEAGNQE
jgi:hypothetical protein